ncbi:MAG: hypothetical protein A4E55_02223 [Pelotomaculum sp. PtaU1.Bin035]|nr:MAG: hypothetical protein A4E55_02223 [Pelotomaculum sp. PtaU1.Bin035]
MQQQHIHCIVNDCHYWTQGNKCDANEILVSTNDFAESQPDQVDAPMASQLTPNAAGICTSTACKTYATKGSAKANVDKVKRMS